MFDHRTDDERPAVDRHIIIRLFITYRYEISSRASILRRTPHAAKNIERNCPEDEKQTKRTKNVLAKASTLDILCARGSAGATPGCISHQVWPERSRTRRKTWFDS